MRILAIETSCDDTGIAVLEASRGKFTVLANVVSSQEIHKNYGGVFPMMAKREHQLNLIPVITQALRQAKLLKTKIVKGKGQNSSPITKTIARMLEREQELLPKLIRFLRLHEKPAIDAIAVTQGPGLEPCLWVGINFARALSLAWNVPIIPVNHIEGHILANFLQAAPMKVAQIFPAMALVVSGGHTQLIAMKKIGIYAIIGETRDDAAGECFDKAAKMLGLGYPGGPAIAAISAKANNPPRPFRLPRPMMDSHDYDFSFSGLKTALLYTIKEISPEELKSEKFIEEISVEIQQAIIDVLVKKTLRAAKDFSVKTILLGGGVSANAELRRQLQEKLSEEIPAANFRVPDPSLSTDNALMIAVAGYFHRSKKTRNIASLKAKANLRIGVKK